MAPQVAGSEDVPDWFKTMTPAEAAGDMIPGVGKLVEPQPVSDEDVPDWLKSLQPKQTTDLSKMASESARSEIPTMKSEPEPTPAEPVSTGAEAFPDWLKDLGAGEIAPSFGVASKQPAESAQPIPDLPVPVEPADQAPVTPQLSENSQVEESFQASGEVKPLNIGDDALGWLESLAAKQGAKPEELLTNPQDRRAEMPDWLREPDQKPDETPVVPPQQPVRSPRETLPLEPLNSFTNASKPTTGQSLDEVLPVQKEPSESSLEPVAKSADHPVSSEEDTMAWLERLSGDQKEPTEGSSISSEEIQKTISEENQPVLAGQPAVPAPEELVTKPLEPVDGEDITITSWLNKLDVEEALNNAPTEQPGGQPPAAPAEDLPDWLKDLENSNKAVVNPKSEDDLPEWLRHPISPVEPELSSAPEVPSWVDENAPVTGQAVPTTPEEWVPGRIETRAGTGALNNSRIHSGQR